MHNSHCIIYVWEFRLNTPHTYLFAILISGPFFIHIVDGSFIVFFFFWQRCIGISVETGTQLTRKKQTNKQLALEMCTTLSNQAQ